MEEQYSSIPPFDASAATPADVYKLDDSTLFKFQTVYKMFVIVVFCSIRFDFLSCFCCLEYMTNVCWESQVVVCNHESLP